MNNKVRGKCPICDASIELGASALAGELVTCCGCGGDLELSSINESATFSIAPEVQEDWGE